MMHLSHWERCCTTVTKTFSGKVMGPITSVMLDPNTLEHLIYAPHGCGEQTLIILGPLVYVAKYLKETDQMTGAMEKKIYGHMRYGVVHEMQYRRASGGFARFPVGVPTSGYPNGVPTSTWLSAFAAKIFSQAREFNVFGNDPSDVICKAVEWMGQQQKPNGAYYDTYTLFFRRLQVREQNELIV